MNKLSKKIYLLITSIALFVALIFYGSSLNYFFFQDDFFEINISKAQNFGQYLDFFRFRNDIIFYRPISIQNYFFFANKLFKLNPGGFRVITFVFFFSCAILIIQVVKKITKNLSVGLLCASLWLLSSIHFMSITWIAAAYNIIGTFFWLLTSLFFFKFLKEKKLLFYLMTLISFLLTIGSFEFSVTWPLIFGFYYFYVLKKPLLKTIKIFSPFIFVTFVYLSFRMLLIKVPPIIEYQMTFNLDSLKAFFWYLLWSLNIPEEFKKQIVNNLVIFNPQFFSEYWPLIAKVFTGLFLVILIGVILPILNITKKRLKIDHKLIIFAIFWFSAGISPVLLLPNHTFLMYLTLSSIGIYFLVAYLSVNYGSKKLLVPLILIWIATSLTTLSFYRVNSWMIEAQRFSKEFSIQVKKQFPRLPQNSILLYQLDDHRHIQALDGENALRAIYGDSTLSIYYNKEDLLSSLRSSSLDQLGTAGLKENLSDDKINNKPVFVYIPE